MWMNQNTDWCLKHSRIHWILCSSERGDKIFSLWVYIFFVFTIRNHVFRQLQQEYPCERVQSAWYGKKAVDKRNPPCRSTAIVSEALIKATWPRARRRLLDFCPRWAHPHTTLSREGISLFRDGHWSRDWPTAGTDHHDEDCGRRVNSATLRHRGWEPSASRQQSTSQPAGRTLLCRCVRGLGHRGLQGIHSPGRLPHRSSWLPPPPQALLGR